MKLRPFSEILKEFWNIGLKYFLIGFSFACLLNGLFK